MANAGGWWRADAQPGRGITSVQVERDMLKQILTSIPHDVGAIVAYLLLGGFVAFIWMGSRKKKD